MKKLDWTGNIKSTFSQLGASNHSEYVRAKNDYYATDPNCLELFLKKLEKDEIKLHSNIWECACGEGHLSNVLIKYGYNVKSTDLVDRNYSFQQCTLDFLKFYPNSQLIKSDILTNPPYKYATEFVEHSLEIQEKGYYTIMLLRIQFLEGINRRKLFEKNPPKYVYVNSRRQLCVRNGDFKTSFSKSSACCFCWFVWEKGWKDESKIRWI